MKLLAFTASLFLFVTMVGCASSDTDHEASRTEVHHSESTRTQEGTQTMPPADSSSQHTETRTHEETITTHEHKD